MDIVYTIVLLFVVAIVLVLAFFIGLIFGESTGQSLKTGKPPKRGR